MKSTTTVVLGSLAGALAIHVAFSACGSGGNSAQAQTSPACTAWQIATTNGTPQTSYIPGTDSPATLPAGWEPIAFISGEGGGYLVRRCAP
jgi:hypothetical protein